MVIGGSPCTFWSIAKAGREVEKDGKGWQLFMRFVEAVRQIKPRFFLYENVASMPHTIKAYITEELCGEPVLINSALLSAQQRKRLYWTNIKGITQPEDKGILLRDIIESGLSYVDKSHCMTARYAGAEIKNSLERGQRTMIFEPVVMSAAMPVALKPVALKDKSQTLCAHLYKENVKSLIKRQKSGLMVAEQVCEISEASEQMGETSEVIEVNEASEVSEVSEVTYVSEVNEIGERGAALRTRADENGSFKRLEVRHDGKLNALTTVQTDCVVCSPIRIGTIGAGGQGNRIYSVHGKTISLMSNGGGKGAKTGLYKIDLPDGDYAIRKLTPIEAERCQTLDDGYTAMGIDDNGKTVNISNTQRYKAIGNGWTIDVIAHILRHAEF